MTDAFVVQHTHSYTVNDVMFERWHEYELKFESTEDNDLLDRFKEETGYMFNEDDRKNPAPVPEGNYCWCSVMHKFLLSNGFELKHITNKFFIFTRAE